MEAGQVLCHPRLRSLAGGQRRPPRERPDAPAVLFPGLGDDLTKAEPQIYLTAEEHPDQGRSLLEMYACHSFR